MKGMNIQGEDFFMISFINWQLKNLQLVDVVECSDFSDDSDGVDKTQNGLSVSISQIKIGIEIKNKL